MTKSGASVAYRLRPNKAVDRELFVALLAWVAPALDVPGYHYVGLGGPFLEDFRLVHGRLGIQEMTCVESDPEVHKRQQFNCPVPSIRCVHQTLEEYMDATYLDSPTIIWFDFTEPGRMVEQIELFGRAIGEVPIGSILKITLNANPSSLGRPRSEDLAVEIDGIEASGSAGKPTIGQWRLARFKERLRHLFPIDLTPEDMQHKTFGLSVLRALKLSVERESLSFTDRDVVWAVSTFYADGQQMVTATLLITSAGDLEIRNLVESWEFHSVPDDPLRIDLPALSTLERLTMEARRDAADLMGFEFPKSDMGVDPVDVFRRFYRIYPHFSRVEL